MPEELKSCPFCEKHEAREDTIYDYVNECALVVIRCQYCGVHGKPCNTPRQATEAWNTRNK